MPYPSARRGMDGESSITPAKARYITKSGETEAVIPRVSIIKKE